MPRQRLVTPLLSLALLTVAATAQAQDLYIGTVKVERDQVVLTRCDLVENRYVLKDSAPEEPVAALAARLATLKAPVYAEVIGEYEEDGDGNALRVIDIQNVQADKSCHLLDAASAPGGDVNPPDGAPELPAPSADTFSERRHAALGAALVPPRDYAKGPQSPDPADYDPNTSGIIYDVAFAGLADGKVRFEVRGYSGDDYVNPASGQTQDFPEALKVVNVRDLAIQIDEVTPDMITYRVKIEPEEPGAIPSDPNAPPR
ncbi:hypothetical protein PMI01_01664 [Caulobacter sp. AP07]|uniref:hypothetical protein n=1 Tax=Caulobacter sp. AP07 TaxID=1144304 RepID=UPI000271D9BF|nr:hypothetical protein [Caulobacter sp. AP07]EJL34363.1 hypothetical protein PMI01_01664 [Caulobacter sp. AP07]